MAEYPGSISRILAQCSFSWPRRTIGRPRIEKSFSQVIARLLSSKAVIVLRQVPNGLRFAAGNNIAHVGTEEGAAIVSLLKIRKPGSNLIDRRNTSRACALHCAV